MSHVNSDETAHSALEKQLTELNNRSRWYATQLWQVPFAYLTITAVAVANSAKDPSIQFYILCTSTIFGVLVIVHWFGVHDGQRRAVRELQEVERSLKLRETAQDRPYYVLPLLAAVIIATLGYALAAGDGPRTVYKIDAKMLNSVGLLLSIVGGCIWFYYGFPQPAHEDSVGRALEDATPLPDGRTVAQHNEEVRKTKAKYRCISQTALALIILGFLCQLVAVWM